MLLTVMPSVATSLARVRANPVTADRTLFERIRLFTGCFTAMDVTLTIRPHRRCRMPGSTARVSSTALRSVRFTARSHAIQSCASNGPAGGPPAFVTRMSTWPKRAMASAVTSSMCSCFERSATTVCTSTPVHVEITLRALSSVSAPRAQRISLAPSLASSSAIARPRPRLAAATSATLPRMPRFMTLFPQVRVRFVQPVLARRVEDIDVERILERLRLVRYVGRDVQHLAGADEHFLRFVLADPELEHSFEDIRELLVLVRMLWHDAAFLQVDVRQHHPVAGDQTPIELR